MDKGHTINDGYYKNISQIVIGQLRSKLKDDCDHLQSIVDKLHRMIHNYQTSDYASDGPNTCNGCRGIYAPSLLLNPRKAGQCKVCDYCYCSMCKPTHLHTCKQCNTTFCSTCVFGHCTLNGLGHIVSCPECLPKARETPKTLAMGQSYWRRLSEQLALDTQEQLEPLRQKRAKLDQQYNRMYGNVKVHRKLKFCAQCFAACGLEIERVLYTYCGICDDTVCSNCVEQLNGQDETNNTCQHHYNDYANSCQGIPLCQPCMDQGKMHTCDTCGKRICEKCLPFEMVGQKHCKP